MKTLARCFSLAILFFGLFCLFTHPQSSAADDTCYDVPLAESQQRGPVDAPVTLIEFLDFQ